MKPPTNDEVERLIEANISECVAECDTANQKTYLQFMKLINRLSVERQLELEELFVFYNNCIAEMAYRQGAMDCLNVIKESLI